MSDQPIEMSDEQIEMSAEGVRFCRQMETRYSLPLLKSAYGDDVQSELASTVSAALTKVGFGSDDFKAVRAWLMVGLKPFEDFPPSIESMIQMASLLQSYPMSEYTKGMKAAWFRLDTEFGQQYGKQWRGERRMDALVKERVWLSKFEEMAVTQDEVIAVMKRISASGFFRTFMPKIEEFLDAILAVRLDNAPMVEEAWTMALMTQANAVVHPLVKQARGKIGAHDLRVRGYDRDVEQRFKSYYRQLLIHPEMISIVEDIPLEEPTYASPEAILALLKS